MATVLTVDPNQPDPVAIRRAAAVLRAGGLVAFPTETVYGLGANAFDAAAVARVFAVKGRPTIDPIIVHVLDVAGAEAVAADLPPLARRLAEAFWPGPLTLVVPRAAAVPDIVTAGLDSVGVRAPDHPVARALIAAAGVPIAAPSANPFGRTSPTTAQHVLQALGSRIDLVLDGGPAAVGVESTVVACRSDPPILLRPGGVPLEALRAVVPEVRAAGGSGDARPPAPGLLARHYAPRARLVLFAGTAAAVRSAIVEVARRRAERGERVGILAADEDVPALAGLAPRVRVAVAGSLGDPAAVARRLFAALHELDAAGIDVLLARDFGDDGLFLAVRDRLTRAAEGRVITVAADRVKDAVDEAVALS